MSSIHRTHASPPQSLPAGSHATPPQSLPAGSHATPPQGLPAGPYESALKLLLPPPEHGLLLTACFSTGKAAAEAWSRFVADVGEARAYFETQRTGLKGLLPFVEVSLAGNGIDAGKAFHTYARVAVVREELRSKVYREILDSVLAAVDAARIPLILLKGAAVSMTAYPQPSTRHNHAIDLLVGPEHRKPAALELSKLRFTPMPDGPGAACHQDFSHWTGLALGLHTQAFFLPYFELPLETVWARARTIGTGERSVRVMSPEDTLLHICGHAIYSRGRANLRWACDVVCLLRRNPDLNWPLLIDTAVQAGLALPVLTLLRWVGATLTPVPDRWLDELRDRSRMIDMTTAEGIYAALLHTMQSRQQAFDAFKGNLRAQLGFLRFSTVPSGRYMRWKHNVDNGWKLAVCYADRPRRFALRAARAGGQRESAGSGH